MYDIVSKEIGNFFFFLYNRASLSKIGASVEDYTRGYLFNYLDGNQKSVDSEP